MMAASILIMLPTLLLFFFAQKSFIEGRITSYNVCYTKLLRELAKSYGVSRVTIRTAISFLVKEMYLTRIAGFGTTVLQNKPNLRNNFV